MKIVPLVALCVVAALTVATFAVSEEQQDAAKEDQPSTSRSANEPSSDPDGAAVERARKTVQTLDNVYKQVIVLITDKYVHDDGDFPAGSAAVLLFKNISETGSHQVRLIDATGDPIEPENVAKDDFEREGLKQLKAGSKSYDQVMAKDGKEYLHAITPVPVVMQKCVMCHAHYADAKEGEPIGAISYIVPID